MKRKSVIIFTGIAVVAIAALFIRGSIGISARVVPGHTHHASTCGVWNKVSSPNVGTSTNFLNGVVAISANNVWAVGTYGNGNGGLTLVEHWNGTQWKVVASPNIKGSRSDSLSSIDAITANNVWAVGSYYDASNASLPLIEHWNGANWSIVRNPDIASVENGLAAISGVSATDIWAVGSTTGNNGYQRLIEHWNGTNWSIVSSSGAGQLTGVTAIASNNVWAVGSSASTRDIQTFIEHWNGTTWSVVSSAGPGLTSNNLSEVAAISANNVWAVGDDTNSVGPSAMFAPLIEHWDGSSWSITSSPLQGTSDLLSGIAAVSASNIWAVGDYRSGLDPMGPYFTLIEHWNGTRWSVVSSPSPGSIASDLLAATRVPATNKIWAAGFIQGSISQTLTEFYC